MYSLTVVGCLLAPLLAGCNKSEPDIGSPPVANLQGVWLFANRQLSCSKTAATFGQAGFYEIYIDNSPRKKLFDITQFAVGGGFVLMDIEHLDIEPKTPLKMTLAVSKDKLKLTDLTNMQGVSYKTPPAGAPGPLVERMQNIFRIAQLHYTMSRCPDDDV